MTPKKLRKQAAIGIRNAGLFPLRGRFAESGMAARLLEDRHHEPREVER
ncbi:MAG TPA: hypothetical protein VGW80_09360 [Solirubrobacterales bacterium]|jgi:hypothetical protein|nr:hypothetical protein [Solirubrobacterales bacterium]